MIDYSPTFQLMDEGPLSLWLDTLPKQINDQMKNVSRWGDLPKWLEVIDRLPEIKPSLIDLNTEKILVGRAEDCDKKTQKKLESNLRNLHPWRKGPFSIFGIDIDTEWRSDIKWDRLKNDIEPLEGRSVLDVGCGNGYHCLRSISQGAKLAVGVDPTLLYVVQFHVFQKYIQNPSVSVFPLGIDDLPSNLCAFDTVFSMGLLYHRRSPLDHLLQLKSYLRDEGELVLETLVIDGKNGEVLSPKGRYAKMPNVWFIPSVLTLKHWLSRMGFGEIRCVDTSKTTIQEQRVTPWMNFESLANFLDPSNPHKTIEGYPAPKRAILTAKKISS